MVNEKSKPTKKRDYLVFECQMIDVKMRGLCSDRKLHGVIDKTVWNMYNWNDERCIMPTEIFNNLPEEKRNSIKQASLELLRTMPLDKITFKNVSDKSGVTRTSLYVYFENKKDLFDYVFADIHAHSGYKLQQLMQGQNLDIVDIFNEVVNIIVQDIIEYGYEDIVRNVAIGVKLTPIDEYQSFNNIMDEIKAYIDGRCGENIMNIIEILFILFKHSLNAIFANFSMRDETIKKFKIQTEFFKGYLHNK